MELGSIGRTFDFIDVSGVLHHMADPWQGWRVLLSLLRPGSTMQVGLYSELARQHVVAARKLIAERGYQLHSRVFAAAARTSSRPAIHCCGRSCNLAIFSHQRMPGPFVPCPGAPHLPAGNQVVFGGERIDLRRLPAGKWQPFALLRHAFRSAKRSLTSTAGIPSRSAGLKPLRPCISSGCASPRHNLDDASQMSPGRLA